MKFKPLYILNIKSIKSTRMHITLQYSHTNDLLMSLQLDSPVKNEIRCSKEKQETVQYLDYDNPRLLSTCLRLSYMYTHTPTNGKQ